MKRDQHKIEIGADHTRRVVIMSFPDGSRAELTPDATQQLRESLLAAEMAVRLAGPMQ